MKTPLILPAGPIPYIEMCSLKIKFFTLQKSAEATCFWFGTLCCNSLFINFDNAFIVCLYTTQNMYREYHKYHILPSHLQFYCPSYKDNTRKQSRFFLFQNSHTYENPLLCFKFLKFMINFSVWAIFAENSV